MARILLIGILIFTAGCEIGVNNDSGEESDPLLDLYTKKFDVTISVSGRVTEPLTGEGIPDVKVSIGISDHEIVTDAEGNYEALKLGVCPDLS